MILACVALAISAASGWCLLHLTAEAQRMPLAMRVALAVGIGLASSSLLTFAALALGVATVPVVATLDVMFLVGAAVLYQRKRPERTSPDRGLDRENLLWPGAVFVAVLVQIGASYARYRGEPLGFWDAFAIWNLKARFFHLEDGAHWQRAFSDIIDWSHTDYPLLLPSGVARLWTYAGEPSTAISALYSLLFLLLSVALAYGSLERLAGKRAAALAGLGLIATPAYAGQGTWQVADVPLSFALLATLSLLLLAQQARSGAVTLGRLAGLFAGLGALTKNEGMLFALAIFAVLLIAERTPIFNTDRTGTWKAYAQGALLPVFVLAAMKLGTGGESDLVADFGFHSLTRTIEIERHLTIASSFGRTLLTLTGWPLLAVLFAGAIAMRFAEARARVAGVRLAGLVLAIQLLGYYGVYLITERDLAWHLGTSNLRLFVQLWPSALLLYFALFFADGADRAGGDCDEAGADHASSRLA